MQAYLSRAASTRPGSPLGIEIASISMTLGTTVYPHPLIVMSYRTRTGDPMRLPIAATTAMFLFAQAVFAQNAPSDCNQAAGAELQQNTTQLQQAKIERTLQGAGFTDIETAPTAFLVRAKNSEAKPVVMVLDPTSMTTAIVETGQSAADDTTGSAK